VGGGGDDEFRNESAAKARRTRFYDARGDNLFQGPATVDEAPFERPPSPNLVHRNALDWGGIRRTLPMVTYSPDVGIQFGALFSADKYGFRKVPWHSRHTAQAGVTSVGPEVLLSWNARFREAFGWADALVHVEYSGINILRFHGFGNGTTLGGQDEDRFKVDQRELIVAPSLEWTFGYETQREEKAVSFFRPRMRLGIGPVFKYSDTPQDDNANRFIGMLDPAPLGLGGFGQVGAYFTPGAGARSPTLALRASGKKVFGTFPFHEAAYVGGKDDVRGLREERFAGDASVFGNAEIRLPLARFSLLFPTEWGIMAGADSGRVYFDDDPEDADEWHTSVGGGIWMSLMDRAQTVSVSVMNGEDLTAFYVKLGLHF
jgi:hypothetical protein